MDPRISAYPFTQVLDHPTIPGLVRPTIRGPGRRTSVDTRCPATITDHISIFPQAESATPIGSASMRAEKQTGRTDSARRQGGAAILSTRVAAVVLVYRLPMNLAFCLGTARTHVLNMMAGAVSATSKRWVGKAPLRTDHTANSSGGNKMQLVRAPLAWGLQLHGEAGKEVARRRAKPPVVCLGRSWRPRRVRCRGACYWH